MGKIRGADISIKNVAKQTPNFGNFFGSKFSSKDGATTGSSQFAFCIARLHEKDAEINKESIIEELLDCLTEIKLVKKEKRHIKKKNIELYADKNIERLLNMEFIDENLNLTEDAIESIKKSYSTKKNNLKY